MERIKKFKVIIFQVLGCLVLFLRYKHPIPAYVGVFLILLTLILPKWSLAYIRKTEQLLAEIGHAIQVILYMFLFYAILTPLAVLKRIFGRRTASQHEKNITITAMDMEKMW